VRRILIDQGNMQVNLYTDIAVTRLIYVAWPKNTCVAGQFENLISDLSIFFNPFLKGRSCHG
jgi:hypothetical protein